MAKADGLLPKFLHFQTHIKYTDKSNIEVQLENVTDLDWLEVVRCKDCRFYYKDSDGYETCDASEGYDHISADGFCAWAKRRDDNG